MSTALLEALTPRVSELVERHLAQTKEWFPHEVVPWERGADVRPDVAWAEDDATLDPALRSALYVNLLTEDNLPYYHNHLSVTFGPDGPWGEWTRRWTAEEGRHSIAIRDYLILTRAVCPRELERARMHQVSTGESPQPPTPARAFVYLALQELATRIAHHNTGKLLEDRAGYEVMKRVAADENLHFLFYRDLAQRAFEIDPSAMVLAVEQEVREFAMPGTGITGFAEHARAIARAGIYDFGIHHSQILVPVVTRFWQLESLEGLSGEAEAARDATVAYIDRIGRVAQRLQEGRVPAQV